MTHFTSQTLQSFHMHDVTCKATMQSPIHNKIQGKPDALCIPISARPSTQQYCKSIKLDFVELSRHTTVDMGHARVPAASLGRYCAASLCCPAASEGSACVGSACLVSDVLPDPTYPIAITLGWPPAATGITLLFSRIAVAPSKSKVMVCNRYIGFLSCRGNHTRSQRFLAL